MAPSSKFPPLGAVVTFEADRAALELGAPVPVRYDHPLDRLVCVAGTVVEVKPMEPHGAGKVPTVAVTIECRTKKRVTIDGAGCYLRVWPGWTEALAEVARCNGSTTAHSPAPAARK